jgi:hypothetical protein
LYLTSDLKKYYLEALNETKNSENEFWKIESGIENHLTKINENENVQTLYSKCAENSKNFLTESYLVIAFTKKVELTIFRKTLPFFMFRYNDYDSNCNYIFNEPYFREDENGKPRVLNLKCVDDSNYFNINHIRITLNEGSLDLHKRFWNDLTEKLTEL